MQENFRLPQSFIDTYKGRKPPFGFDGLGEFVFYRTYSHVKPDGTNESWTDVVRRVVDETYSIQKQHAIKHQRPWSDEKAQRSASEMFDRMWNMKFLPPGRGLWAMGAPVTRERKLHMALQNCAFVSTKDIANGNPTVPFEFMMDVSMLGVGCGFDTFGAGQIAIQKPVGSAGVFVIEDSREGWVASVRALLRAFFLGEPLPIFDYTQVRPAGLPIKGFGGISSGPKPLMKFHHAIVDMMYRSAGKPVTSTMITDIMNLIGQMVVAGNVRRTAQLAIGHPDDHAYLDLKNYAVNPHRMAYGWTSNNSVLASVGMDYNDASKRTQLNGEPGYIWLDNARRWGRINHPRDADFVGPDDVDGFNPCVEQPLKSFEVCTLVETFPANHDNADDFYRTLQFAFLYAKTVTLAEIHWEQTNEIVRKNRRIGTSMTGIIQAYEKFGREKFIEMMDRGYEVIRERDRLYSEWLGINESVRVTTVKPSGTVSLLGGATPGVHRAESEYYIRRVRIAKTSPLLAPIIEAGYHVEDAQSDPEHTAVIEFPVHVRNVGKTIDQVDIWDQIGEAATLQKYWSDNGVSVTVTVQPEEGNQISRVLTTFDGHLKAASFLPKLEGGAFPQMPYEQIDEATFKSMSSRLKPLDMSSITGSDAEGEAGCVNDVCEIKFPVSTPNGVTV